MIVTRAFMDQTWTDLSSPTKEELDSLILAQNIDPLIAKDLLAPTPKQHTKEFNNAIYAVIHLPLFKHAHSVNLEQEIDFIITEKNLVTTRYDSIDALHHFAKQIEVNEILNKENHTHLLFGLLREVYKFLFDEVEYTKDWLKDIEKNIFKGREKDMVFDISEAGINLLSFKRVVSPHETVWRNLAEIGKTNFGEKFGKDAKVLMEESQRLMQEINHISDMLDELRETNNSLLSTKQNEAMKTLTILAFVTFPLSVIAAIFGMSSEEIPLINTPYGFWLVLGLMFGVSLAMFSYFKYKKWI